MDEFDEWAAYLGTVSGEVRARMRRVFDEHGPVSPEQLDQIWRDDQLVLARVAVGLVGHDIAGTTAREAPPFGYRDEDGSIRISYWGQYATSPVSGLTQGEVIVEVADFMQDEVMEDVRGVLAAVPAPPRWIASHADGEATGVVVSRRRSCRCRNRRTQLTVK